MTYDLNVFSAAGLEKNQSHVRVLNEDCHDDQVAGLVFWVLVACTAAVCATEKPVKGEMAVLKSTRQKSSVPSCVDSHGTQIEDVNFRALRAEVGRHTGRS
jgi:hypothetical protein